MEMVLSFLNALVLAFLFLGLIRVYSDIFTSTAEADGEKVKKEVNVVNENGIVDAKTEMEIQTWEISPQEAELVNYGQAVMIIARLGSLIAATAVYYFIFRNIFIVG